MQHSSYGVSRTQPSGVTISFTREELAALAHVMDVLVIDRSSVEAGALDSARFKILDAEDTVKICEDRLRGERN